MPLQGAIVSTPILPDPANRQDWIDALARPPGQVVRFRTVGPLFQVLGQEDHEESNSF